MCNMERIGLIASEEMSFENVDGRTTDGRRADGRRMLVYTISSPMSLRLRRANNKCLSLNSKYDMSNVTEAFFVDVSIFC